jgi:hypothetical protein
VIVGPVRLAPQVPARIAAGDLHPAASASSVAAGCSCTRAYSSRRRSPALMSSSAASGVARVASHAGSWYSSDPAALTAEFDQWLTAAGPLTIDPATTRVRAIISPSVSEAQRTLHITHLQSQATITHPAAFRPRAKRKRFQLLRLRSDGEGGRGEFRSVTSEELDARRLVARLGIAAARAAASCSESCRVCHGCSSRSSLLSGSGSIVGCGWCGHTGVWLSLCVTCRGTLHLALSVGFSLVALQSFLPLPLCCCSGSPLMSDPKSTLEMSLSNQ